MAGDNAFCDPSMAGWITKHGWYDLLRTYVKQARTSESQDVEKELLWLYVPNWEKMGIMD